MTFAMTVLVVRCAAMAMGWFVLCWIWRRQRVLEQYCEYQRKRGDYWFDKYQREIDPSWQFLGEWHDDPEA